MDAKIETDPDGRRIALDACASPCAIERGMRVLGGKWTGSILWHLKDGPVRFNDLSRMIAGASKKILSERLQSLQGAGLVSRRLRDTKPPSVEYALTDQGRTALGFLEALKDWSETHLPQG